MSSSDRPLAGHVAREFTISRDPNGHWVASEAHGFCEGVFFHCKDALRFALREADGDAARVHLGAAPDDAGWAALDSEMR